MPAPAKAQGLRVALLDPGDFTPPYDEALARGLAAVGCDVRLYGMAARPAGDPGVVKEGAFYRPLGGCLAALPRAAAPTLEGLLHGFDLARLARALAADGTRILHLQWTPLPLLDLSFVRTMRRRMPVVLTLHDTRPYNAARGGPMVWGLEHLVRAVDAVIVHTEEGRARLVAAGLPGERVHRVPHGLLEPGQAPEPNPRHPGRPLEVLQFGQIKPYKGIDLAIAALARLAPERRRDLRLRIVGRPQMDLGPLRHAIAAHGLEEVVELRPAFVSAAEMAALFARADLVLLPYRMIDASGVAMVAIAHGRPVVASALPSFVELFGEGRGARLFPPGDAAALARILDELATRAEAVVRLAAEMRALRAAIPSWTEIGRATVAIYGRLLAERRIGGAEATGRSVPTLP